MFIEHLLCIKHYSRHWGHKTKFLTPWSLHCCETLCPKASSCNIPTDCPKIQPGQAVLSALPAWARCPATGALCLPQLGVVMRSSWPGTDGLPSPAAVVKGAEVSNSDQNVKRQAGEVGEEEERWTLSLGQNGHAFSQLPEMWGGGRNPGLWGQVGRGQASRRSQLKGLQPIGSAGKLCLPRRPEDPVCLLSVVPAAGQDSSGLLGGWGPLAGGAVQMDTEHAAQPPPVHSTLDPENTVETTRAKTLQPREAWAQAGLLDFSRSSPNGWGLLRGGEGKTPHPGTWLQPGWEAGSGLWAGAAPSLSALMKGGC